MRGSESRGIPPLVGYSLETLPIWWVRLMLLDVFPTLRTYHRPPEIIRSSL